MKKGPGRRPLSAKRRRFMEFRAQGWSIRGAGREVGVSRTAANNWARGYTVFRGGVAVAFVEPLDRPEVREISPRFCPSRRGSRSPTSPARASVSVRSPDGLAAPRHDLSRAEAQPKRRTPARLPAV